MLSLSALLAYFAVNPHRRPRGLAVGYWLYLMMMRAYLALAVASFSLACYTLTIRAKVLSADGLALTRHTPPIHVILIAMALITWAVLFLVNGLGFIYYKVNKIRYSPVEKL